ncbi:hypothetical protein psal_cds_511 [Pandoravirus salinus]|uniref:Uncharacterized protein n=1 Tax=Pandoravirus salinus TaxID=1349410 RepID=S4W2B9_9VIRU|nr:hypothetical protein psal_cds_511 [Pandoravirus salinus]AGO84320.1 hypothetical protein psal_cds_511 [Pandoravirus salinus]
MSGTKDDASHRGTSPPSTSSASRWNPLAAACDFVWDVASTLAPHTYPRSTDDRRERPGTLAPDATRVVAVVDNRCASTSPPHAEPPTDATAPRIETSDWMTLAKKDDGSASRVLRCRRIDDRGKGQSTFEAVVNDSVRRRNPKWHGRPGIYGPMGPRWPGDTRDRKYITDKKTHKATVTRAIGAPWPTETELLVVFGNNLGAA